MASALARTAVKTGPKLRVLISGAGIAGTCHAYWLARSNLDTSITIVERAPSPRLNGQAIDIRNSAISVIQKMGLEQAIRDCGTTETGAVVLDASGKPLASFPASDASFTAEFEILRSDLAAIFMDATKRQRDVEYLFGDYIVGIEQGDSGPASVAFASGKKEEYDLVVVADGASSRTRKLLIDEEIIEKGYNFLGQYAAFFSIPHDPEKDDKLWKWFRAPGGRGVMIRPHRNPKTMGGYLIVTTKARGERDVGIEQALNSGIEAQKQLLRERFSGLGWETERVLEGMSKAKDFYMSRTAVVKLPKWISGRTILLGDAAWATMGIGTSLAIEGAYVLASELGKIQHGTEDVPEALARYESVFRPYYEKAGSVPSFYPQGAFPQTKLGLGLTSSMLWLVSKTKIYKLFLGGEDKPNDLPEYKWV